MGTTKVGSRVGGAFLSLSFLTVLEDELFVQIEP